MFRSATFLMIFCMLLAQTAVGQHASRTVSGLLTSAEDGAPLEGVRVVVKGSGLITGTLQDGMFYLPVTDKDSSLLLSRDDILPTEIRLTSATDYSVKLHVRQEVRESFNGDRAQQKGDALPVFFFTCDNFCFLEK
jgi:hypothetical protein